MLNTVKGMRKMQLCVSPSESLCTEHTLIQTNGIRLNSAGSSSLLGSEVKGEAGGKKWVARENNIYSYLSVN